MPSRTVLLLAFVTLAFDAVLMVKVLASATATRAAVAKPAVPTATARADRRRCLREKRGPEVIRLPCDSWSLALFDAGGRLCLPHPRGIPPPPAAASGHGAGPVRAPRA